MKTNLTVPDVVIDQIVDEIAEDEVAVSIGRTPKIVNDFQQNAIEFTKERIEFAVGRRLQNEDPQLREDVLKLIRGFKVEWRGIGTTCTRCKGQGGYNVPKNCKCEGDCFCAWLETCPDCQGRGVINGAQDEKDNPQS